MVRSARTWKYRLRYELMPIHLTTVGSHLDTVLFIDYLPYVKSEISITVYIDDCLCDSGNKCVRYTVAEYQVPSVSPAPSAVVVS